MIRLRFNGRSTFDCLSKVVKVTVTYNPLAAVTLTYLFI